MLFCSPIAHSVLPFPKCNPSAEIFSIQKTHFPDFIFMSCILSCRKSASSTMMRTWVGHMPNASLRNSVIWRINSISNEYHVFEVYVKLSCSSQQCHWTFSEKEVNLHKHILHLSGAAAERAIDGGILGVKPNCVRSLSFWFWCFSSFSEPMRTIKKNLTQIWRLHTKNCL